MPHGSGILTPPSTAPTSPSSPTKSTEPIDGCIVGLRSDVEKQGYDEKQAFDDGSCAEGGKNALGQQTRK